MTSGFRKFLCAYLCAALALVLALGAVCGGGIWKAIRENGNQCPDYGYYSLDGAYAFASEMLQGQRNLFAVCGETLSAPDPEDLTVEFAVRAVPFEVAPGGSAAAFVRGTRIPLRLRDGVLEGSARLPIADLTCNDEGPLEYRVLLQGGGTQRNQFITPEFYFREPPLVGGIDTAGAEPSAGKLTLTFHYELDDAYVPFGDTAAKANVYALTYTYGGAGAREQNLMFNAYLEGGALDLEESFEVGKNDLLRFYGEVVGESGMVYRYWLQDFVSPEYEDLFEFPWWEEDLQSGEYIYIAGTDEQVEFWF